MNLTMFFFIIYRSTVHCNWFCSPWSVFSFLNVCESIWINQNNQINIFFSLPTSYHPFEHLTHCLIVYSFPLLLCFLFILSFSFRVTHQTNEQWLIDNSPACLVTEWLGSKQNGPVSLSVQRLPSFSSHFFTQFSRQQSGHSEER